MEKPINNPDIVSKAVLKKQIPLDFSDLPLSKKEFIVVISYCTNGFNTVEALIDAGYKAPPSYKYPRKYLSSQGVEILNRPHVSAAVNRIIQAAIKPYKDKIEYKVLETYYARAFYRVEDFYNDDGTICPLSKLPDELKCIVDGITRRYYGKDADVEVIEYQLPNRDTALQALMRVVNLGSGTGDTGNLPAPVADKLADIRKQAEARFGQLTPGDVATRGTTTYTAQQTVEMVKRGRGRPRKQVPEVEIKLRGDV